MGWPCPASGAMDCARYQYESKVQNGGPTIHETAAAPAAVSKSATAAWTPSDRAMDAVNASLPAWVKRRV